MMQRKRIAAQFCGGYILEDGTVVVEEGDAAQDNEQAAMEQRDADADEDTGERED